MAIYIPEFGIPDAGQVLIVRADGTCRQYDLRDVKFLSSADEAKAVQEIGPHGRLIDADAMAEDVAQQLALCQALAVDDKMRSIAEYYHQGITEQIEKMETIIPEEVEA